MADLVSIGFEISTRGIKAGIQELDKLAKSGDKVQKSVDKFGNELKETDKEMGRFIDKSGRMREKNGQFVKGLEKTNSTLKKTSKSTKALSSATDSLAFSMRGVVSAATAILGIRQADSYQLLADRVALATKETGDFASVQAELFRISQDTGTGLQNNVELFDRIRIGAQELGKSNTEVLQLVEAVDMLAASGGTSQEAVGNATLQLSQALAGGILRAEEFNSIVENTPKIAQAIAEGLNTSIGGLRAMVLEGNVLADDVFSALLSQTDQISEDFEEMPIRLGRATTTMGNSVTAALGKIDSQLGVTGALADGINDAAGALDNLVEAFQDGELDDSLELLSDIGITLGSAAIAYKGYTTAVTLATVAQKGFNFAVRVNPIGLAVSAAAALGGIMFTLTNNTDSAADAVKKLTGETVKLDKAQRMLAINEAEKEKIKLQKELANVIKQQTVEQERFNKQLDIYAANAELDTFREPITNPFSEEDIKTVDKYGERIAAIKQGILELDEAIKKASTFDMEPIEATVSPRAIDAPIAFDYTDQYQEYADAMKKGSKTGGENLWESIGQTAGEAMASEIASAIESNDWSDMGKSIGTVFGSALGSAFGPAGAQIGGAIGGKLLGGREVTGTSSTISLSGGLISGSDNTRSKKGFGGSTTSRLGFSDATISALTNSFNVSISNVDNAFENMGFSITTSLEDLSSSVDVAAGDYVGGIEKITESYISANFAAIEDYARAGETFIETFERINEEMVSVIDSFTINTTSGTFQEAVDRYTEAQTEAIETNAQANIEALEAQIEALEALPEPTRETGSGNIVTDIIALQQRYAQIESLNAQISEQISRIGGSLQTATVDFSNAVLESIATIEGISSDDAVSRLNQLTASYEENYFTLTEQTERAIESARKELEEFADLGIDETTSLDEFQTAFEAFVNSDAFTPEGYSQWLLAADALADLNNVVDDIDSSGTFESITDFVKDLMGLAVDGTETLAAATAQYQETLALAQTGDADALAAITTDAQAYLDAVERSASTGTDVIIARSQVASDLSGTVPAFATGGSHTGGLRLVGENGPEIEATGPSRIFSNSQSKSMLDNTDLTRQVAELRQTMESGMFAVAKNTNKSYKVLNRWDTQGLPEERTV